MAASGCVVHALRLGPGEDVFTSLIKYVTDHQLGAPFIMTCVGSLTKATLRLAAHTAASPNNDIKEFDGPFEIVSLVGTLNNHPHLHISLSDRDGHMVGGHVIGGLIVFTTAEIVIGECTDIDFTREFDSRTGFPELVVNKKSRHE